MMVDKIMIEVRAMLTEIIGAEYALGLGIGMDTSFDADLQLESIEFVRLATMLTERYGDRVDFVAFLASKDVHEIMKMKVGEVVTYVANCLTPAGVLDG